MYTRPLPRDRNATAATSVQEQYTPRRVHGPCSYCCCCCCCCCCCFAAAAAAPLFPPFEPPPPPPFPFPVELLLPLFAFSDDAELDIPNLGDDIPMLDDSGMPDIPNLDDDVGKPIAAAQKSPPKDDDDYEDDYEEEFEDLDDD